MKTLRFTLRAIAHLIAFALVMCGIFAICCEVADDAENFWALLLGSKAIGFICFAIAIGISKVLNPELWRNNA